MTVPEMRMSSARVVNTSAVLELVVELMRALGGHHGHRAVLGAKSALDVEGCPRALRLVLGDDVGELAGVPERAAVEQAGERPADVPHDQAQRPPDGQLRASLAKRLSPALMSSSARWVH
jgi:hypothetical protein